MINASKFLKKEIKKRGLKQEFLCSKMGKNPMYLSRILNNKQKINLEDFEKILNILGYKLEITNLEK